MHYLVTGGAGYIGSHLVHLLIKRGHNVTILDNFSTGHRWATQGQETLELDLRDLPALREALTGRSFHGVFHFAANSLVGQSNQLPLVYYQNNVGGTANLLELALENDWKHCVFSSTAAVYGNPKSDQIREDHPTNPINVYGQTKLIVEEILAAVCAKNDFHAVCLRYFNAAGAVADGSLGESHDPETHLVPNALKAAHRSGPSLTIFGNDYPTPDGTCIRDFVHVDDLAVAHLKAMDFVKENAGLSIFNLGTAKGYSVNTVLQACETAVGSAIPHEVGPRREGDPAILVANALKAQSELGWKPERDLNAIVTSAWRWEQVRATKGDSRN